MDLTSQQLLRDIELLSRAFLESEARRPTLPRYSPEQLESEIPLEIPERGIDHDEVMRRLVAIFDRTPRTATRRFFNQLFGGRDPSATVAEVLASLANVSMYTFKAAGPQILIEREVIRHMGRKMGFEHAEGVFAPGGSLSNLIAMLVARDHALQGASDRGVSGARLGVYTSEDSHYSIPKAAAIIGIGRSSVRSIPVDDLGRMRVDLLRRAIERDISEGVVPVMVNATSGTTVPGSFDPIRDIAGVTKDLGVWLHVDGAFGGSVILSRSHRDLLDGSELADSIAWDAHKMMGIPLTCSVALFRERGRAAASLAENAEYLFQQDDDDLNPGTRSLQCGRRNDAIKLWAAWQRQGDEGYADRIDRLFSFAQRARAIIDADDRLLLACEPMSVNVCFEVVGRQTDWICQTLDHEGLLKVGHGVVNGRRIIRIVFVNPDMSESDVDEAFEEILACAMRAPPSDNLVEPAVVPKVTIRRQPAR